jgi:hypothetical protein
LYPIKTHLNEELLHYNQSPSLLNTGSYKLNKRAFELLLADLKVAQNEEASKVDFDLEVLRRQA